MLTCAGCAYRKYIGNGHSLCSHAKIQLQLLRQGKPPSMKPKDYPERCHGVSDIVNPDLVGARELYFLEKLYITGRLTPKNPKQNQQSLF